MAPSAHNYTGVFEKYGISQEFHASSLRALARKMEVHWETAKKVAALNGEFYPNCRIPIKITKTPKTRRRATVPKGDAVEFEVEDNNGVEGG
ncbi:hypothetical protein HK104_002981, partial [Borealophlyctis nickersoniae]